MNSIKAKIDKSPYDEDLNYLNFYIDNSFLDETLEKIIPQQMHDGLVPTLLFWMEIDNEREIVWDRILPKENQTINCPILMCPDDCDFSCTLIIAQIERKNGIIIWKKLGLDETEDFDPKKVGSKVNWFSELPSLSFSESEYVEMINGFKNQFNKDKKDWEEKRRTTQL